MASGEVRIHGRATQVFAARAFGRRISFEWLPPFATIAMTRDQVTVGSFGWIASDGPVRRDEVSRVHLTFANRHLSFRSVVVEFADQSLWRYQLGPPQRVLRAFAELVWPVTEALITAKASFERARLAARGAP
jgi:hypothetical protein